MFNRSIIAFIKGLELCVNTPRLRKLMLLPWMIGVVSYPLMLYVAYLLHTPVLAYATSPADGIWSTIVYGLTWALVTLLLFIASMFTSVLFVLIASAAFQTAIVEAVLREVDPSANRLEEDRSSITSICKDSFSAIATEAIKYLWLLPVFIVVFALGFIPFLTPFAIAGAAWLVAFQFIDIVLDVAKFSATKRIRYSLRHWFSLTVFGATVTLVFLIPFAGILLAPVATAGAAWMLSEDEQLWNAGNGKRESSPQSSN